VLSAHAVVAAQLGCDAQPSYAALHGPAIAQSQHVRQSAGAVQSRPPSLEDALLVLESAIESSSDDADPLPLPVLDSSLDAEPDPVPTVVVVAAVVVGCVVANVVLSPESSAPHAKSNELHAKSNFAWCISGS
jgi:hypothetical protein